MIKEYLHHADNLPPKEKALEKTKMLLELILVIAFLLEVFGIVPATIINYILAPGIVMYAILYAKKGFKTAPLLSIMMIVLAIVVSIIFIKGLF